MYSVLEFYSQPGSMGVRSPFGTQRIVGLERLVNTLPSLH